jgi:hypothetical protein
MTNKNIINESLIKIFRRFFIGGNGPTHREISTIVKRLGIEWADPLEKEPSIFKTDRIELILGRLQTEDEVGNKFVAAILGCLSEHGFLADSDLNQFQENACKLAKWLDEHNLELSQSGEIVAKKENFSLVNPTFKSLDTQYRRLMKSSNDGQQIIGYAKELLEATMKYVLERTGVKVSKNVKLPSLIHQAMESVDLLPEQVEMTQESQAHLRSLLQNLKSTAGIIGEIRNDSGTGHGRVEQVYVPPSVAKFVSDSSLILVRVMLDAIGE